MKTRRQRVTVESPTAPAPAQSPGPRSPNYDRSPNYIPMQPSPDYGPPKSPNYDPPKSPYYGAAVHSPEYQPMLSPAYRSMAPIQSSQPIYRPRTPPPLTHPYAPPPPPPPPPAGPPPGGQHYTAGRSGNHNNGRRFNRGATQRNGIPPGLAAQLLAWIPSHVWNQHGMHPPLPFGAEHEYLGRLPPRP